MWAGNWLSIWMYQLITAPTINGPDSLAATQRSAVDINRLEEAQRKALLLRSGALPVNVKLWRREILGPTLSVRIP